MMSLAVLVPAPGALTAAHAQICDGRQPSVLSLALRGPTAQQALTDHTLTMIVTCGA